MKIGDREIPTGKAAVLAALWVGCWAWPVIVRPMTFSIGRPADAIVRRAQPNLFGLRCKIIAATKLGDRSVRFYTYGNPQACKDHPTASAVKLRLLQVGPLFWVQLENDYGYWYRQIWLAFWGFLLLSAAAGVLIYNWTRPREKSFGTADLKDLLNKL